MVLTSPAVEGDTISATYHCSNGVWLPLQWQGLPADATELVLYVAAYGQPEQFGSEATFSLIVAESLMVGLEPQPQQLVTGPIPSGARKLVEVGVNACPPSDTERQYLFRLFALNPEHEVPRNLVRSDDVAAILERLYSAEVPRAELRVQF